MTTLLAALALALNAGWLGTARLESQATADAAALAAVARLIDDDWLRTDTVDRSALLGAARVTADEYAARNRVLARPIVLAPEDFAVGALDEDGIFQSAVDPDSLDEADEVRVAVRRLRSRGQGVPLLFGALSLAPHASIQSFARARLDRDVIGFRARVDRPIPILPLGLRLATWESAILLGPGIDTDAYSPGSGFTAGSDGIPEVDLILPLSPDGTLADGTGAVVSLGTGNPYVQIMTGATLEDLAPTQGILSLDTDNELAVTPTLGPIVGSDDYSALLDGLEMRRAAEAPVILPLLDDATNIIAFVAVRVVRVTESSDALLTLRLQPAMMAVPQAITDATRRGTAALLPNPYLARPRLAR
jgi:hypothetical protein